MKQKKYQYKKAAGENGQVLRGLSFTTTLSPTLFYGVFLALSLFLSVTLCGASQVVANMRIDFPPGNIGQLVFEHKMRTLVTGYPIEAMSTLISEQNKTTAAFLVGIAKKESNWGKRVPRAADGSDCYNYWGYRGAGSRGIAMGHGCFGSPEEAVGIVGGRLDTFVEDYKFRTPQEMIVWKCGFSCAGHSNTSVKKWIADVGYYYDQVKEHGLDFSSVVRYND
ncbi:MAG: hypothetical protein Q8O53_02990 [Candidatus Moranbacteria bacterium]|nr:hypothetical protein [Candidatus Moranbacteria bacterium]